MPSDNECVGLAKPMSGLAMARERTLHSFDRLVVLAPSQIRPCKNGQRLSLQHPVLALASLRQRNL